MPLKIAIAGAGGRMGRRLIALASADPSIACVAALERSGSQALGRDAGTLAGVAPLSVEVCEEAEQPFDVLIEFSLPAGTMQWLEVCRSRGCAMVIGTTGHDDGQSKRIKQASESIAVLKAPNMSVGVNVMLRLARMLGETLDESFDVEITEAHHRFKVDAPSGTALALRDEVVEGRTGGAGGRGGKAGADASVVYGRHGKTGERSPGEIGMHSLRMGDVVGRHSVAFGTLGETVTVSHEAHSRDTFVSGALRAAKWIAGKPPGLYSMQDVLFA